MHLETDPVLRRAAESASQAAQVVLAGGEKHGVPGQAAGARHLRHAVDDPAHRLAPHHLRPERLRPREQRGVEHAARQAHGRERQRRFGDRRAVDETDGADRLGAERGRVEAEAAQIGERLGAEELAADLVVRRRARARPRCSRGRAGTRRPRRPRRRPRSGRASDPADAEPERDVPPDPRDPLQPGRVQQPRPVRPSKTAADADRAIVPDHRMPAGDARERGEAVGGDRVPLEVVDEPAAPRGPLHPLEEPDDIGIRQVVGEQRADHHVDAPPPALRTRRRCGR